MASTNSQQYGAGVPRPGAGPAGDLKVYYGTRAVAANPAANDTLNMFTMAKGFVPLFGWVFGGDIDTNAAETIEVDVGIPGAATKYLDSGALNGDAVLNLKTTVGIWMPLMGDLILVKPTALTADTDCIVTFTATAATFTAAQLTVVMCGLYNDARVI